MNLLGPALALLSSLTWAVGSSRYSMLSHHHSPFAVNLARALFALPLFVLAAFIGAGGWNAGLQAYSELRLGHFGWFALSMIASYGLGDVLFLTSTKILGVPTALAIASCYPLWTAGAARIFRSEGLAWLQWLGLVLAVVGVVAVIIHSPRSPGSEHASGGRGHLKKGIFLAFLTSVMWALNSYSCSQGGRDIPVAVGNTVRMIFAIGFSSALGRIFIPQARLLIPRKELVKSTWVFVLEAFGGSYFYMYGLTHSPLAVGATLSSLAPVMAVPIAWALGAEKLSIYRTLAICLVVMGIGLLLSGGGLV